MRIDPKIDSDIDDSDLLDTESNEWNEYQIRQSKNECTCDLLSPMGHVTCRYCNEA